MSNTRLEKRYLLSTLVAVTGVKAVTFNAWRNRNKLFPWTQAETGWKLYSLADICVAYCVKGFIESGCTAQNAVDFATALLPKFEQLAADEDEAYENSVALVMRINHADDDNPDIEVDVEFFNSMRPVGEMVAGGRLGWGTCQIVDLVTVFADVLRELNELAPETVATEAETRRLVFRALAEGIRPSHEPETPEGD